MSAPPQDDLYPRNRRAFTLIEMLVAITILAAMILLFAQIFGSINQAWGRGREKMDNYAKARALMNRIQTDLQGIVMRGDLTLFPVTDGKSDFAFYTLQKGFNGGGRDIRTLSFIKYMVSKDTGEGKLIRSDKTYASTDSPAFAAAPTPNPSPSPVAFPTPPVRIDDMPAEDDSAVLSQGSLGFAYGFLHPDGKFYPTYSRADSGGKELSKAIAVTVALIIIDNRTFALHKERGTLESLISDFRLEDLPPIGVADWSPKMIWEYRLGLLSNPPPFDSGAKIQVEKYGASNIDTIKVFERTLTLPSNQL